MRLILRIGRGSRVSNEVDEALVRQIPLDFSFER